MSRRAGVLALQGDFAAHMRVLAQLGVEPVEVRRAAQLEGIAALLMPGGESTAMSLLLSSSGLREPLKQLIGGGLPTLATCAGAILLARELRHDSGSIRVETLGLLDATIDRNAYGRQVDSFESALRVDWAALGSKDGAGDFHGVFIRAPQIREPGPAVVPVAWHDDEVVAVRQGSIVAAAFHPELSGDTRLHQALLSMG